MNVCKNVDTPMEHHVCILVEGMLKSPSMVYLNLSHNCFSNSGVAELCKLWNSENSVLAVLNVCNNAISVDGAKIIGESLRDNEVLVSLNLRHNPIEDDGGQAIFVALQSNMTMQRLCVSACGVGERTAASVQRLLQNPRSGLIALDISANRYIGVTGGFAIYSGLSDNLCSNLQIDCLRPKPPTCINSSASNF
ncbi:hypothetical protein O6H91_Y471700 [Diphasiastrum complanatum]|nr:hypothetical protein O6H91_Y471700 [Diphasiastrum complanatum]